MDETKNNKKLIWFIASIVLIIIAVVSGIIVLINGSNQKKAEDTVEEMVSKANEKKDWADYTLEEKYQFYKDKYGIEVPRKNLDFEDMHKTVNKDIYAWIYVPEIGIEYPVVQHPSDDSYYLDYNLDGSKGYPGGIFTEGTYNKKDFTDRMTVIYGHNMKNGTGFAPLHKMENGEVFDKTRYIYIYTPDDIFVYQIYAAYTASDTHLIAGFEWNDQTWVEYCRSKLGLTKGTDHGINDYEFTKDSKVLTLSTCVSNPPNKRYLVQGVLLR